MVWGTITYWVAFWVVFYLIMNHITKRHDSKLKKKDFWTPAEIEKMKKEKLKFQKLNFKTTIPLQY